MFQQIEKNNIATCRGCEEHCKLGYKREGRKFWPMIGNCTIKSYINENDEVVPSAQILTWDEVSAIKRARLAAQCCDFYQH